VIAAMLVLFAAASLLPEVLAVAFGHSMRAWEYFADGTLAMVLIMVVGAQAAQRCAPGQRRPLFLVLAYGMFEAAQRPACRLVFPMDRPPVLPDGQTLCEAAGLRTAQLSILIVAAVGFAVAMSEHR
jgi:hypothetical protein